MIAIQNGYLPCILIGEIFKHCPHEIFMCIRFLHIRPRTLEIMLRPRYIARRDMSALEIRGTLDDVKKCVKHKWRAGYFYLCGKFNAHNEYIDRAVELGLNVDGYYMKGIEYIVRLYSPLEEFKKLAINEYYLTRFRIPAENFNYWCEKSHFSYDVYIFQNRWDLALECEKKTLSSLAFCSMSKKRATSYIEFCHNNNIPIYVHPHMFDGIGNVKKYHFDLIQNHIHGRPMINTEARYRGCKFEYFDLWVRIYHDGRDERSEEEIFMWSYKRGLLKNFEQQFCKSIKYINNRDLKKILHYHGISQKVYDALIVAGRFKVLKLMLLF